MPPAPRCPLSTARGPRTSRMRNNQIALPPPGPRLRAPECKLAGGGLGGGSGGNAPASTIVLNLSTPTPTPPHKGEAKGVIHTLVTIAGLDPPTRGDG